jgi:hypothetical protein
MNQLEVLARQMFERYATRVAGHRSSWDYLSKERKLAWMEEVLIMTDFFVENLQSKMNNNPLPNRGQSGYENGLAAGAAQERQMMKDFIHFLDSKFKKDLEEFRNRR